MLGLHTGTRIELMKTKIDFEKRTADYSEMTDKKVDDLTVKLNGISLLKFLLKSLNKNENIKTLFF
jgi:hypothetical protein